MTPATYGEAAAAAANFKSRTAGSVRTIRTLDELDRLETLWERLAQPDGNPIKDFAYQRAWSEGLRNSQRLSVFLAERAGTAAIAPLVVNRGAPGWLTLLAAEMYEVLDFLYDDQEVLQALVGEVARSGRPLFLKRLRGDSPALNAIYSAYRGKGVVVERPAPGSPWIPLDPSWGEPEAHLKPDRRSDLRRARRIAEKIGLFKCEILSPDPVRAPALIEEVFQVEATGWKGSNGSALATDPIRGAFFRRYTQTAAEQGKLRLAFLRLGGQAAAAQIAIESGGRFSLLRAGYHGAFSRCSPGILLTMESIRYASRRGLQSYEFNGEVEPWTRVWTKEERACCSIRTYPFQLRGLAALAADGWGTLARRIRV